MQNQNEGLLCWQRNDTEILNKCIKRLLPRGEPPDVGIRGTTGALLPHGMGASMTAAFLPYLFSNPKGTLNSRHCLWQLLPVSSYSYPPFLSVCRQQGSLSTCTEEGSVPHRRSQGRLTAAATQTVGSSLFLPCLSQVNDRECW